MASPSSDGPMESKKASASQVSFSVGNTNNMG